MERAPFQTVPTTPAFPLSRTSSSTSSWSMSPKCRCRIRPCCRRIPVPALNPTLRQPLLQVRQRLPSNRPCPQAPPRLQPLLPNPRPPRLLNPQRPRKRPRRLNRKRSPSSVRIAQAAPAGNSGVAAISCCVYCSRGCAQTASASPISTSRPRSITAIRVLR